MKKRGSIVANAMIVIIISALIVASFYNIGEAYGTEEVFYKFAVAKDLAIHLDLIYSLPGDIEYIYPNDVSKYDVELKDNKVSVFDHNSNKLDPTIGVYEFVGISSDKPEFMAQGQKFVKISKSKNKISITGVSSTDKK